MGYYISQEASLDIENIWMYTYQHWSPKQADRYFNLIMDEIAYLAKNPESGKDYGQIREGYFRAQIKSHFIFYKITRKKEEIEVIRVLHQSMDIEPKLNR